jgi:C_GCAxxG_C_C family probable redox protein
MSPPEQASSFDDMLRMLQLAGQGFHCSQILLFLGLEAQGKSNPDLIRAMAGLAGGVGFCGDICGALTGGACLIALYAGRGDPDEEEDPRLNLMVNDLVDWFTQEFSACYGGIHCQEILADDPKNQSVRCPGIVSGTYQKATSLLLDNGFDLSEGRA